MQPKLNIWELNIWDLVRRFGEMLVRIQILGSRGFWVCFNF